MSVPGHLVRYCLADTYAWCCDFYSADLKSGYVHQHLRKLAAYEMANLDIYKSFPLTKFADLQYVTCPVGKLSSSYISNLEVHANYNAHSSSLASYPDPLARSPKRARYPFFSHVHINYHEIRVMRAKWQRNSFRVQ